MKTTRRSFIKTVAIPMVAAPFVLPSHVWAAPPSNKVVMGFVGMGYQMRTTLFSSFLPRTQAVAVCEVDTARRTEAQQRANKQYKNSDCKAFVDYRELMAMKGIDAVCIATPDHWHAAVTLAALKSGKDVYCEKPLTWCLQEAIDVIKAVDENKRVLQTGSMQRSMMEFRVAAELVRNGCIGKIDHVECDFGGPPNPCNLKEESPDSGLDWNMWLGPAPMRPYNAVLSPRGVHEGFPNWRGFREYGTGGVGDWGAHHLDIANWGLGMDDSGPVEVRFAGKQGALVYANGIQVLHKGGFGVHFFGSDGQVMVNRDKFKVIIKDQTIASNVDGQKTSCAAEATKAEKALLKDAKIKLYNSKNHHDDFLKCVASRAKPVANEQAGGRTAICCHLLNQLYYNKQAMKWDPVKLAFAGGTGNPAWMSRQPVREWAKAK